MATAYIILGSNLGDKQKWISSAIEQIEEVASLIAESHMYETAAWGGQTSESFYNQCIAIDTLLSPEELLHELLRIEKELGRIRNPLMKYGERTIDLDILYYDDLTISTPILTVPHPRMQDRKFVLTPLCDIAPSFYHPTLKRTNLELLNMCQDNLTVKKV